MRWDSLLKFKKLKNWNWLDEIQEEVSTHFSGLLMLAKKIYMYEFAKYFFFSNCYKDIYLTRGPAHRDLIDLNLLISCI